MPNHTKFSDSQLLKQWQQGKRKISAIQKQGSTSFIVEEKGKEPVRVSDLDILGIPKVLINNLSLLNAFLNETYVKLSTLSDGSFKVHVLQKGKGGGNTIDPTNDVERLWPNGVVYYEIDLKLYPVAEKERDIILEAIKEWNAANNGFTFEVRTKQQKDFVVFGKAYNECFSNVGKTGKQQYTRCDLGEGGGFHKGSIKHEMGHVIGLYHEQSRFDRDSYVQIKTSNHNYNKEGKPHDLYDFDSMMHYPLSPLSREMQLNVRLPQGSKVGQRDHFSEGDLAAIAYLARAAKDPEIFKKYAFRMKNEGKHDKVLEYFQIANDVYLTQRKSKDWESQYEIGLAYFALNQREEAKKALKVIIDEAPTSNLKYKAAKRQLQEIEATEKKEAEAAAKQRREAIGSLLSSTSKAQGSFFTPNYQPSGGLAAQVSLPSYHLIQQPRTPEWQRILNKANKYYQRGDYQDALTYYLVLKKEYGTCLEKICNKIDLLRKLGDCYYKAAGEYENALEAYQEACEYAESLDTPYDRAELRNRMGHCYTDLNQFVKAREAYEDAVEIDPYYVAYRDNLKMVEDKISRLQVTSANLRYQGPKWN